MKIKQNISLKPFNTFHIDVIAKYFAEVNSTNELLELLSEKEYSSKRKLFLGGGSNILFTKNFDGMVIKLNNSKIKFHSENNEFVFLQVEAGVEWDEFVKYTVDRGLCGIENLSLIPGTVGAAPIQNIGAYGVEVKNVIESVNLILLDDLKEMTLSNSECNFGYRHSIFKNEFKNKFIITSVLFRLFKNQKVNLKYSALANYFSDKNEKNITVGDVRDAVIFIRKSKLPDPKEIGNAGSFFKNPVISKNKFDELKNEFPELNGYSEGNNQIKISAGWLVEKCGLKGKRLGNVGVHEKQALVIVNYGNATGMEILTFSEMVKEEVKSKFNIELINEVNII